MSCLILGEFLFLSKLTVKKSEGTLCGNRRSGLKSIFSFSALRLVNRERVGITLRINKRICTGKPSLGGLLDHLLP